MEIGIGGQGAGVGQVALDEGAHPGGVSLKARVAINHGSQLLLGGKHTALVERLFEVVMETTQVDLS